VLGLVTPDIYAYIDEFDDRAVVTMSRTSSVALAKCVANLLRNPRPPVQLISKDISVVLSCVFNVNRSASSIAPTIDGSLVLDVSQKVGHPSRHGFGCRCCTLW
jgi:hypothetical protein